MPPPLLKGRDVEELPVDEFLRLLAMARYLQELEGRMIQNAVAGAFAGGGA